MGFLFGLLLFLKENIIRAFQCVPSAYVLTDRLGKLH